MTKVKKIRCVWEHNGSDSLLYADNFPGAFTRGASPDEALRKMPSEIRSYLAWRGETAPDALEAEIVQEKRSGLAVSDADSDVPTVIIGHTIKGYGVSFMEGKAEWHHGMLTDPELLKKALEDVRQTRCR